MSRLLAIDFEVSGLDVKIDRPVECGIVLWESETKAPIVSYGFYLWDNDYPTLSAEVIKINGITDEILKEFGGPPKDVFTWVERFIVKHKPEAIVAHNGNAYDKPLLLNELKRLNLSCPQLEILHWIDTMTDLPSYGKSKALNYVAADHGFLNPFPHRAIFDCLTSLKILSHYDVNEIIKQGKIPKIKLKGRLSPGELNFEDKKNFLKSRKYTWDGDQKWWVREFKEDEVDAEIEEAAKKGIKLILPL